MQNNPSYSAICIIPTSGNISVNCCLPLLAVLAPSGWVERLQVRVQRRSALIILRLLVNYPNRGTLSVIEPGNSETS